MHEADQPQNTSKTLGRDATAQIGGAGEAREASKIELLHQGLMTSAEEKGHLAIAGMYSYALGRLEKIAADLTSADKRCREDAKRQVRELVKLGKES